MLFWGGLALVAVIVAFSCRAHAQSDVIVSGINPYQPLARGIAWGNGAACNSGSFCGMNNNFIWTPPSPDSTVCVSITNNNPTNSHTVTFALSQALDPNVQFFTGFQGKWGAVPLSNTTFPVTIAAGATTNYFFRSSSAARLALQVSGSAAAGGSPDTADIVVVQPSTASFCGSSGTNAAIIPVIGATQQGAAISATNQAPVLVGGQQAVGGAGFLNTAQFAAVDSTTHGFVVGVGSVGLTESSAPAGTSLNYMGNIVGGQPTVLYVQNEGQQTDIPMSAGAGDTMSPFRCSKPYGCTAGPIFGWASSQSAGASGSPLSAGNTRNDVVNPAANTLVLEIATNTGATQGLSLLSATVSCSAACDFFVQRTTDTGTTCGAGTVNKPFDTTLTGTLAGVSATVPPCVTAPTSTAVFFHIFLAAGQVWQKDLTGYYWRAGVASGNGFDILNGASLTGTITATLEFMVRGGSGL